MDYALRMDPLFRASPLETQIKDPLSPIDPLFKLVYRLGIDRITKRRCRRPR
jgi:hypothetical protein